MSLLGVASAHIQYLRGFILFFKLKVGQVIKHNFLIKIFFLIIKKKKINEINLKIILLISSNSPS